MKDAETKLMCFELRAQGKSLNAIAAAVGVRRQTVANWLREHQEEVENLRAMELDALREACWMTKHARIEHLSTRLEQIRTELETRDFSDVPTAKLMDLEMKTRIELAREFSDDRIRSEQELREAKGTRVMVDLSSLSHDVALLTDADDSGNGQKRSRRTNNASTN